MKLRHPLIPFIAALAVTARAEVVIDELMYHPSSENPAEEYVELFNSGAAPVALTGWQFTSGVTFTFPNVSVPAGGYLVVAANAAAFSAKYPAVTNFVAGWTGRLSNSSNNVVLKDALLVTMDSVNYSDDGDWAQRWREEPPSFGHRGWGWHSDADGFGKSLELINVLFDNNEGQNWAASTTAQGTPGAANSVAAADIAPVIDKADHFPLVPKSTDSVTVTCRVRDDHAAALTVQLHYRNDGAASFTTAAMFDDGAHGDAAAGDGYFGAAIAAKANGTIVEFYFTASDGGLTRTWPAPARDYTAALVQTQNCLYQVDDAIYAGAEPIYRMVLRAVDRTELSNINSDTGAPPFPYNAGETNDQTYSHARFNATWVTHDGTGDAIVYLAGVRNRGNGSRYATPQSYNVAFRNSDAWKGVTALNLNTQNTPHQLFGSAIFRKAGLTVAESRAVQVRVNGANLAGAGAPSYGFYCANEVQNTDFADNHFPLDGSGNIYRGFRQDSVGGANLRDQSAGQPAATADPAPYRVNYFKQTNESEDKWADLIGLTKTLAKGTSIPATYAANYTGDYVSAVQAAGDPAQWLRFMAASTIADNTETNIANGDGDDYYLYFGATDPRAVFVAYDLDSIFGRSATSSDATHNLFRMARGDTSGNPPTPLHPFIIHPQFAREYLAEVKRQLDGPFSAAQFAELANETLGGVVSATVIDAMKTFHDERLAYIAGVMPLSLSGTNATTTGGTALTITSGYPRSTAATCNVRGKADCTRTASVKVNGVAAIYTPWKVTNVASFTTSIGDWQANSVALTPGINRLHIQAFDSTGAEIEQSYFDVWYDDATIASVSGAIAANTTWTAAGGPYQFTANLTVNSGVTLTIAPGTSVYLASGVTMTVAAGGRILAEGTAAQPIRFTRAPGTATNGGTITVNGQAGVAETHFYYTVFEFGGNPAVTCAVNSNVILDHCEWLRNDTAYLHLDGGSFIVSNCIFPASAPGAYFEGVHGANAAPPAGGRAIIRDCFFGKISSDPNGGDYNDVFDFTGGNRPGPILQFYNNVMVGSDDDLLDIDGTDMWCEGNIFMHVHRKGSPDSASAVSGGNDGGGGTGSRRAATAIDTATEQITCGTHGFATGQEVVATALLGDTFPAATPALHNGGPYFVRAVSTTVVKLYLTAANATADTGAINFTGTIGTGVSLSLTKLDAVSHITIVGNLFYDLDQAATAKEGNFYTLLNNTVVAQSNTGSEDALTGVLNFGDDAYHESGGMYAEGNVIHSAVSLVRNYPGAGLAQTVTWNNNLFPTGMTWSGAGSGNTSADARLNDATSIPTPGPYDYQRVAAQIRQKFGLQTVSPARGTGPNGGDKGGVRPLGVSIGGAPSGTTNATGATLTVGTRMSGSGIPAGAGAWANGSGWTHYKWRIDSGAWSAETPIATAITLSGLANGTHTVEVAGKNDALTYQDSTDLGTSARVSSATWTVNTSYVPPVVGVRLNEVLAANAETLGFGGVFPDIIELHNAGTASADLAGWGLTENAALPYKYTIPAGTTLAAGARLVIYASTSASVPLPRTGFGLKQSGDTLTLTRSASAGGGIADSVAFGNQITDRSIGRAADGSWELCVPTFGAVNVLAATAPINGVKINEWLADAVALFPNDFIELMNTATQSVNVGNCHVSDNPVEWPQHHQLRQLTFIAAGGYLYLKADDDAGQGPDHLSFKLASEQGEIGFFDSALNLVDGIVYGPQTSDISQGRTPNGTSTVAFFNQPTPGGPNPGVTGVVTTTTNLIPVTQSWRYRSNGTDHSADFIPVAFDDSGWTNAPQLLYIETNALTNSEGFTKVTALPSDAGNSNRPYNATYFRTHFTYSGPLTGVTLRATTMIDDGAVFYLNGVEIIPTNIGARLRMPTGAITFDSIATGNVDNASVETLTFSGANLVSGDNVLCVAVHQEHGAGTQTSSDVTFGLKLDALTESSAGAGALVINEVLPINATLQNPDGSFAGWVELSNPSGAAIDVSDMSLSDDTGAPRKFVFGAGASVPAGGYLVTFFNPLTAPSATNTGYALPSLGGGIYLFEKTAAGGGLHDGVSYGLQIADFAIGRTPNGSGAFALTVPTRGALNTAAGLGAISGVKLNEWLANPAVAPGFFEIFNTAAQPVALGGNYLTDLLTNKTKHAIPPLSFIGGSGGARWRHFIADNDAGATPGHVNFSLNPLGESLGIFSGAGVQLDAFTFGAQASGIAQGRFPDGTSAIVALTPTPGSANVQSAPDTDGDGIPDAWETANGLNPNNPADAAQDADGDGQTNAQEYTAGTNPQQPGSRLAAAIAKTATPGQYAITFTAIAGHGYTVRYKNDLSAAMWTTLAQVTAPASDTVTTINDTPGVGKRFYQVITPQQP